MIKKASSIASLSELNLSPRTHAYLIRTFDGVDTVIREGRFIAYDYDRDAEPLSAASKWKQELVSALKEAGLIRPASDFAKTLRVGALYRAIYPSCAFVAAITELSNEQYENFSSLTWSQIEGLRLFICERLSERTSEIITLRYGLGDEGALNLEAVACHLGMTRERVRQLECKAIRSLKKANALPALFDAPSEMNETISHLQAELDELHRDPVFQREREILDELRAMRKLPLRYSGKASDYLRANDFDDTPSIRELDLSVRTFNCLGRAGINTIADVLELPEIEWFKIKNLGHHGREEVVEKMHAAGYRSFQINS